VGAWGEVIEGSIDAGRSFWLSDSADWRKIGDVVVDYLIAKSGSGGWGGWGRVRMEAKRTGKNDFYRLRRKVEIGVERFVRDPEDQVREREDKG